jgi:hypothetical protein
MTCGFAGQKLFYGGNVRTLILFAALAGAGLIPPEASAAPSAVIARKCMQYSYIAYPYKRPGSTRMSGDRQSYFRNCMTKEGDVPEPVPTMPST